MTDLNVLLQIFLWYGMLSIAASQQDIEERLSCSSLGTHLDQAEKNDRNSKGSKLRFDDTCFLSIKFLSAVIAFNWQSPPKFETRLFIIGQEVVSPPSRPISAYLECVSVSKTLTNSTSSRSQSTESVAGRWSIRMTWDAVSWSFERTTRLRCRWNTTSVMYGLKKTHQSGRWFQIQVEIVRAWSFIRMTQLIDMFGSVTRME